MNKESPANPVKQRRAELGITQQEAAKRADVSLATWRRFEQAAGVENALDGFRTENLQGFTRALRLSLTALRRLVVPDLMGDAGDDDLLQGDASHETADVVRIFNASFTGNPLTPADAMALATTIDFSDFAPTQDGQLHTDSPFMNEFADYLKGEATIRDVHLLRDLPELALTQVSNHWLVRMGERIMRINTELGRGRVPHPQCLADEYALWLVIMNAEPPQTSDMLFDAFPGLHDANDVFGYDPDVDDPHDDVAIRAEWMNRVAGGLLPRDDSHDHRRHDLEILEFYGQSIYDPTDPRHPQRWFDRDDLRERCESELAFVRLPKEEQEARSREALERASRLMFSGSSEESLSDKLGC